jgi:hypothetical protein
MITELILTIENPTGMSKNEVRAAVFEAMRNSGIARFSLRHARMRWYVGRSAKYATAEAFPHHEQPTQESFGKMYDYVIGPFKTKRGAEYYAKHGKGKPHALTVKLAESLARIAAQLPKE